ncbi:MAG: DUF1365 domain-containing protein [Nitrospiraceae bacterium]
MNSCIYEGKVRHRRFSPAHVAFQYTLFMMYLDLEELPTLFEGRWLWSSARFNLAWFRRRDHYGNPNVPLDQAIRDLVQERLGARPQGPIHLLTHLRYFGYCFNPVSVYYCYDPTGAKIETVVAEVRNTPWGEQHCYVLGERQNEATGSRKRYRFDKAFHVSPFMDMDVGYDWSFTKPTNQMAIHMQNLKRGEKFFDATMALHRRELTAPALARMLMQYPLMTAKVIAAIHFQALRLWWHRCPYYPHPNKEASRHATGDTVA